jgi:methylenetetrahydrofolate reductase (NADPH)
VTSAAIAIPFQVSFEFFPPNTAEMEETLWRSIKRLEPLAPRFVSVTYGAAGSARERTHRTVRRILAETGLAPAAHLTCAGSTREEVDAVADAYWDSGVRHIVALRGDASPGSGSGYAPHPGGYAHASDLVKGLRARHDFQLSVAAHPEGHPEAPSMRADLDNLKRKIDAGATRAITQFFFDNDIYFRFVERAQRAGITVPIVPGIMPVTNFVQMRKFAATAGASVPTQMGWLFEGLEQDPETRRLVAATVAAEQCLSLAQRGVNEFHFFTLNRADLSYAICHILGLRPGPKTESGPKTEDGNEKGEETPGTVNP